MTKLLYPLRCLLLVALFGSSCQGQVATDLPATAPTASAGGQPTLVRTQGTTRYASVDCGLQDNTGKLWFGTTGEGLYRYDGKLFTNFTTRNGLTSNSVCCVLQATDGTLWVGTSAGLCRYDGQRFTAVPLPPAEGGPRYPAASQPAASAQPEVRSLLQDRAGQFWLGTSVGLYRYDGTRFTRFGSPAPAAAPHPQRFAPVPHLLEDRAGNIWFTTWFEGIYRFDGQSLTNFRPNGEVWFDALAEDRAGHIWVGRRDRGVCRYDGTGFANVVAQSLLDTCGVTSIAEDAAGNMWFGTEAGNMTKRETTGGAWRYQPAAAARSAPAFTNFTTADGLSHNSVFCIVQEKNGNLWFGTRNVGLCRYDGKTFTNFSENGQQVWDKIGGH